MANTMLGTLYTGLREALWASPLVRSSAIGNVLIRLGYLTRRWLRLAPHQESIGMVDGHQVWFGPDSECYFDMTHGTWEPSVSELVRGMLKPGMTMVDIGGHIGYFTLLAARAVGPTGRVFAFEPAPYNFGLLQRNVALNGYEHVVLHQMAVADKPGKARFYLHPNSVGHSLQSETLGSTQTAIDMQITSLDEFFRAQDWPKVDLVKMDIEGAEPAAIQGMRELIERNPQMAIIFEYIPRVLLRAGIDPNAFLNDVRALGFTLQNVTDHDGVKPLTSEVLGDPNLRAEILCTRPS